MRTDRLLIAQTQASLKTTISLTQMYLVDSGSVLCAKLRIDNKPRSAQVVKGHSDEN